MSKHEYEMWAINIENAACAVATEYDTHTIDAIFAKYGAHSFDDLSSCYYTEVFADLEMMANDI